MRKPKNILQGIGKGGIALLHGIKEGITGLFIQPYEYARKEGALGFIKGTAKGLAGLIIKPITGVIDFASKTTEGIKNNLLMFDDRPQDKRIRYPRVFYT